jgi:hypothetical protein
MIKIEMDPGVDGKLDKIGKALNKALVFTLTDSAKFANEEFLKDLAKDIDKPAPFTLQRSGYGINIARFGDANPFSEAYVKPAQSAYLQFIIESGGVRGLGQAGASDKHVWVPGQRPGQTFGSAYSIQPKLSPFGGVPNAYSEKLYDLTGAPTTGSGPRYSNGGVFWGTIKGRIGFWARPKRTKPVGGALLDRAQKFNQQSYRLRQRGPDGKFVATGRASLDTRSRKTTGKDVRVQNKGVPILLLCQ